MDMRADALSVAAKVIAEIDSYPAIENNGTVATVGVLDVKPGAANIVPGEVSFTVDIRSKDYSSIQNVREKILSSLDAQLAKSAVTAEVIDLLNVKPV